MQSDYYILLNEKLKAPRIEIHFPFDWIAVDWCRDLPDRKFHELKSGKFWSVPASPYHANILITTVPKISNVTWQIDDRLYSMSETADKLKEAATSLSGRNLKNLYPFQSAGVRFLQAAGGRAIIGDEMGLGKTVQALTFIRLEKINQTVIVAPASVIYKWKDEAEKWLPSEFSAEVVPSSKSALPPTRLLIMSYTIATLRYRDIEKLKPELIIFDEVHYLKGQADKVKRVRAALSYSQSVPYILGLSGTPFLNRPIELFNILNLLSPSTWNSWWDYAKRYCDMDPVYGPAGPNGVRGSSNREELAERLKMIMIRRTKKEVLDQLPDLNRVIMPVKIKMKDYHEAIKADVPTLVKINLMRQAAGAGKVAPAIEWSQNFLETSNDKLVIYCHHHEVVDRVVSALESYVVGVISGKVSNKERHRLITKFQNELRPRVLVITSAGGEGIDLFSKSDKFECNSLLFVEREWSPLYEEQVEARLHRNGQRSAVTAYYLSALNTIDQHFAEMVEEKREVFKEVVGSDTIETIVKNELIERIGL